MARIRCFLLEDTNRSHGYLRRYRHRTEKDEKCTAPGQDYHNAMTFLEDQPTDRNDEGYITTERKSLLDHSDPRWPTQCPCDYVFQEEDEWQIFTEEIYRRVDTGEEMTIKAAPAGAMWEAWWLDHMYTPQGEHNLMVKTPGGEWAVDSQASNCAMKEDYKQEQHHCWVREGIPPNVTVSKNGPTCSAGAGSIQCRDYHGFLRDGFLEN